MLRVLGRGEVHAGFWRGHLRERDQVVDIAVDVRMILKWIFRIGLGYELDYFGSG